jgi:hypothetical protein
MVFYEVLRTYKPKLDAGTHMANSRDAAAVSSPRCGANKKGGRSNRSPLKGTVAQVEDVLLTRLLRLFRGFRFVPGGQGSSPICLDPTPMRV